jgi:hypothetical protein
VQGKKRKDTVCIVLADETVEEAKIRMNKVQAAAAGGGALCQLAGCRLTAAVVGAFDLVGLCAARKHEYCIVDLI